ncbi:hypothetical protein [Sphingobium sp. TCM1]|uniref:hypothetical protein n=1 Tax=Sphingobium sp. TCM1 TaxID=453246 RepID=UPI0007F37AA6|nr:hypothetical protein [Sphingobium sp. TCM1]OAN54725.1 hypothetical protein A7Q26_23635 [Sphingobium sp. TCM1]
MAELSYLERQAICAILAEKPHCLAMLDDQLQSVMVESRENTGGGFFTTLSVSAQAPAAIVASPLGLNVYASVDGMEHGIGLLLFFEHGRMSLLEGYSVGGEDTSTIEFERTAFAITDEPTAWRGNVR